MKVTIDQLRKYAFLGDQFVDFGIMLFWGTFAISSVLVFPGIHNFAIRAMVTTLAYLAGLAMVLVSLFVRGVIGSSWSVFKRLIRSGSSGSRQVLREQA